MLPILVNLGSLALHHLQHKDGAAYLPEQMLVSANSRQQLFAVKNAPCIERPVFAVYRSGSDREDSIGQALSLLQAGTGAGNS